MRKFRPNPLVKPELLEIGQQRTIHAGAWLEREVRQQVNDESSGSLSIQLIGDGGKMQRVRATLTRKLAEQGLSAALQALQELVADCRETAFTGNITLTLHCLRGEFGFVECGTTEYLGEK